MKKSRRGLKDTAIALAGLSLLLAIPAKAAQSDAEQTLGFENATLWSSSAATIATNTQASQGTYSLAVTTSGYATINSRLLGPLGTASATTTLDVLLPAALVQASWPGAIQLYVSVPSLGINNYYLGDRSLSGLPAGTFQTLSFFIPDSVRTTLQSGSYHDLSFSIALNLPTGQQYTVLLDNLRFSAVLPPDTTIGNTDIGRLLDFEDASLWTMTGGQIAGLSSQYKTSRNFALAVVPGGYSTITSAPISSWGPLDPTLSFDLYLPAGNENLPWAGAIQVFLNCPSRGVYGQYLGQTDLTHVAGGQFQSYSFPIPSGVQTSLNAAYFSDLTIQIVLNVPSGNTGTYYIDKLRIAKLPDDTSGVAILPMRPDIVGRASSGAVSFSTEQDSTQHPPLLLGIFNIEAIDGNCAPSVTQACAFQVNALELYVGAFSAYTQNFQSGVFAAIAPFRISVGGAYGMTGAIPTGAAFSFRGIQGNGSSNLAGAAYPIAGTNSLFITPSGDGMVAMTANFAAQSDGHTLSLSFSTSADTPLVNRPPIAVMQPLTYNRIAGSPCVARINLDATGTSDPDGDSVGREWYDLNGTAVARGLVTSYLATQAGTYTFTLKAIDKHGSFTTQTASIPVALGSGCP